MSSSHGRPAGFPAKARAILILGGAISIGWMLDRAQGQAPPPTMVRTSSMGILPVGESPVGTPVPLAAVATVEQALGNLARNEARGLATTYAHTGVHRLPGVNELGRQLLDELAKPGPGFDFAGVVSHNPAFWQAERELAPDDVSLPYLVSMLAILSRDYVTAARFITLGQATLPLTPSVRRGYGRPEAMLLYLDHLLLTGVPSGNRMQTADQCETSIAALRERIARWSNRPGLLRSLIELEVRRVELLTHDGENLGLLDQRISERLNLTAEDVAFARNNDPILAAGFDATVRQWLNGVTLEQKWSRWIELGDPAELAEVDASVVAYAANGRPELAWLAWRFEMVLRGFAGPPESQRWKPWCERLLDAKSAAYVETAAKLEPGQASLPIENEGFSEAWAGDQRIHPLLAVKIERQIALLDTLLALTPPGSFEEGSYRMRRAQILAEIDAVEPSRRELRRIRQIIGDSERIQMMPGVKVMEGIKIIEARLLDTEGHFTEAQKLYEELLRNPRLDGIKINYQAHLFMAGSLDEAHTAFRAYARDHETDTYRSIMADLTARRVGQRETALLETARRSILAETWPADGVKFLLGELTDEALLASARQGTRFEIIDHECEATFWLAEVALAEGRKEDAIKWLNRCLATGYLSNMEFKIAKAELERLAPAAEQKQKKSGPENSNGVITT